MAATAPRTATLRLRRTFPAPPERVFRAWTDPEALKRWSGPGAFTTPLAEVDLRVGGAFRIHMRAPDGTEHRVRGVYREVAPPARLVYTWQWETEVAPETLVTVEFHDRGGATEVVLTHERFPDEKTRTDHEQGWSACFEKLAGEFSTNPK